MKHVNIALLEKIAKMQKQNRDEIKSLIAKHQFYSIKLDIPLNIKLFEENIKQCCKGNILDSTPLLKMLNKDIVISESGIGNLHISCYYNAVWSIDAHCINDYTLKLQGELYNLPYDRAITISISNIPIMTISAIKNKSYYVDYSKNFNVIKNYPDKNCNEGQLLKLISPYYFTGYMWKIIWNSNGLNNTGQNEEIWISHNHGFRNDHSSVKCLLPEKYRKWRFN